MRSFAVAALCAGLLAWPQVVLADDSIEADRFQFLAGDDGAAGSQSVLSVDVSRVRRSGATASAVLADWRRPGRFGLGSPAILVMMTFSVDCTTQAMAAVRLETRVANTGKLLGVDNSQTPATTPRARSAMGLLAAMACHDTVAKKPPLEGRPAAWAYVERYFKDRPAGGPLP